MTRTWITVSLVIGASVAHMALGVAAWANPSVLWMLVLSSITVGILSLGIIPAIILRNRTRTFWVGFATIGWFYIIRHFGLVFDRPRSVMNPLLDDLSLWRMVGKTATVAFQAKPIRPPLGAMEYDWLLTIGHSWLALLVASCGGLAALLLLGSRGTTARRTFVIADLMIAVGCTAVGLAALHDPSNLWMRIITTLVLTILTAAIVPALIRCGPERNYWVGFLICGWLCFLFHFGPYLKSGRLPRSPLDSLVLDVLFAGLTAAQRGRIRPPAYSSGDLVVIGNAMLSLIAGFVGGRMARSLTLPDRPSIGPEDQPECHA